jgi:hypothetical protein
VRLADLQRDVTIADVHRVSPVSAGLLTGGDNLTSRFAIHSRHYSASLARSLIERFAATAWLVGSEFVIEAALRFVREHPPIRPCIAEYGDGFPPTSRPTLRREYRTSNNSQRWIGTLAAGPCGGVRTTSDAHGL